MSQHVPIAVIGVACRFPGADDHRRFWDVIRNDRSQVGEVPQARWDMGGGEPVGTSGDDTRRPPGRWAGLIDDVDAFDAQFFRLSPLEAESTDPQQRIMLELAWSCLEDAAIAPSALSKRDVGVFIGSFNLDYKELQERQLREVAAHHSTGTIGAVIANRVSHFFDFHGPSVVVDTASSASLHALHLAVQSLQQGECALALAGGINLVLTPARHTSFAKTGMLSPTGSCRPFDERADGYVRGEGGGTVLLKPLPDAVRDGDHIYGVIKGSAVNHSGRTRTLTYPSDDAQAQVVADALARAEVSPDTIGYVEAHGTGTPTGDPVEFEGLVEGFRRARGETAKPREHNHCGLGSVKPNIGHLEAAAGIAGLIKVLLALEHQELPGLRDFQRLNPRIDLDGTPFHIVGRLREWEPLRSQSGEPLPRRASVSSFGIGGTNAHVVLEEAPAVAPADPQQRPAYLVCLSARTGTALRRRIHDVREWLDGDGAHADLFDLSATLLLGREHLDRRTALVVRDRDDLRAKLTLLLDTGRADDCFHEPAGTPSDGEPAGAPRPAAEAGSELDADLPAAEYRERLLDLAESFAEGHDHRWEDLFTSVPGRRLRLPTYAFDRHRFWITPDAAGQTAPTGTPASATGEEPDSATSQEEHVPDVTARTHRGGPADTDVRERVEADLRNLVGGVLKLAADEIRPRDRLSDLGCDSVGNTTLALRLSEHYDIDVAPSLFYGYFTLEMLRDRLLEGQYADAVVRKYAAVDGHTADEHPDQHTLDETARAEGEASVLSPDESVPGPLPSAKSGSGAGDDGDHRIAVIGMSGRFPQARTVDEFWRLLAEGREAVTPIPAHRLGNWAGVAGARDVRGGWLPGEAEFDPLFFEISPKEAEHMDPRQRLLLQEAWRALEDAGYGAKQIADNTMGMFVGAEQGDYPELAGDEQTLTSGHDGILASRLSYFLDFSGPVLTVNTACSAGLAAVHQACLSLRGGECDTAIAAGVSLLAGPRFHEHATQAGMLSPDGVCYAFDKRANGMVMGEAIAAVVLKPLTKALADGDRVHAVITASGLNHDGRTNGITAPSQPAQAALLDSVYQRFGVRPADIEHVIAHGTGTRLGDPVEVNALTEAFRRHTDKTQYCALTSVKTNVGHTLAASGVVSLIALVQALRHRTVPASLHAEQESEYIDWARSPFRVNKEARPWPARPGRERTGAVSSFGISGTNVHVVVESHGDGSAAQPALSRPSYLLALSAKTEEALRTRVADLLAFLRAGGADDVGLARISSTLLAGRHHFAHRCAVVADNPEDAERLLRKVLDGKRDPQVFRGLPGRDFRPQNALAEYGNELIGRARAGGRDARYRDAVRALADLYCQGYEPAWENLFGDRPLPCVSLPGYPFARETYWTDAARAGRAAPPHVPAASTALHPLLDSNVSTLRSQRFAKRLSATEFFLRDHVVDGKILLPGVAHMEMAYTASRLASGSDSVTLRSIIWGRPIVMDGPSRTVHVELTPLGEDALEFVVHDGADGARTVFSQGRAGYAADRPTRPRGTIDIPAIKARCTTRRENAEIFASLRDLGFGYGETFQAMETLYCGETEALARIVLGDGLDEDYPRFTLHPSLFDAALNALRGIGEQDGVLRIPFSLEELVVFAPIPRQSYCHATVHRIARDGTMSVDLAICDDSGAECVRLTGLVFKEFTADKSEKLHYYVPRWTDADAGDNADTGSARGTASPGAGRTLLLLDDEDTRRTRLGTRYAGRVVRVRNGSGFQESGPDLFTVDRRSAEDFDRLVRTLHERDLSPRAIVNFWPLTPDTSDLTIELESLLHLFRAVHRTGAEQEVRYLSVQSERPGPQRAAAEALSGFGRAVTAVDHLFRVDSLQVAGARDADAVAGSVLRELGGAEGDAPRGGHEIRHVDGVRQERVLRPWTGAARKGAPELPLKEGGVYLISGGAGALGLHVARYLARQCRARLLLLGRRQADAALREEFAALEAAGAEVLHLPCDVADRDGVSTALDTGRKRFGDLDGVFHGAGVIGGTGVMDVDWAGFEAVLAPKTHGTVHLDELTAGDPLDFFLVFSSIAAYVGDFGQGSYAAANRFLDGYVQHREELRAQGLRHGRSVSVNWPYWDEGGMLGELAEEGPARTLYRDHSGMRGLRTEEGIGALLEILTSDETQVVVTKGERRKIERVLRVAGSERAVAEPAGAAAEPEPGVVHRPVAVNEPVAVAKRVESTAVEDSGEMFTRTVEYLRDRLSQVFHIPKGRIDAAAELGEYGIESIQIMELMRLLTKDFDSLPGTLFFEYRTIHELAEYFTEHQAARLTQLLGPERSAAPAPETVAKSVPAAAAPSRPVTPRGRFAEVRTAAPDPGEAPSVRRAGGRTPGRPRDVAVIGMSGRYPKSRNLDEFWKVLERGEDCIEEIPPHRWDKDLYYAAEKTPGKSSSKWGGFIGGAENFDALFFNMSANQAALTDPQTRLFLQAAWEAMEDAGYTRRSLSPDKARKVGVYLGMMWNEYQLYSGEDVVLSDRAAASNAVSYFFDLHGQSLTVDTACSSSLYAIAMAVESIRNGSSSLAFAGGANLSLHPNKYVSLSQMNFFSADGRCRSFGEGGTGYVPGEGVGCLLLKPFDQAVEDGDHIHGVIRGVATVHGGKTNGMTVPNPLAQADMVAAALADAGLSAEDVSYVEGHGTGTALGDPIEITGLTRAFRKHTDRKQYCPIGSVKSNIGHLEGAAGVVAVTKVLLQMRYGMLVPSLHSEQLNPYIDFPNSPFYVQHRLEPWERPTRTVDGVRRTLPRIAGVSSFGAHGAIAHVIIEEYQPGAERPARPAGVPRPELLVLSAKDDERLREKARGLHTWLSAAGHDADPADLAYTLQVGREPMEERLALVVDGLDALRERLRAFLDGEPETAHVFRGGVRQNKDAVALLEADEEMRELVRQWLEQGRHDKLANVWVKGLALDWTSLARHTEPRRIPLPTYPFVQERHWLDAPPALALQPPRTVAQDEPAAVADAAAHPARSAGERTRPLAFVEDWEPAPLRTGTARAPRGIVFLCTGAERQEAVARAAREIDPGLRTVFVGRGDAYRKTRPDHYQIRRGTAQDYLDAFRDIAAGPAPVDAVVSIEALEPGGADGDFGDVVLTVQAIAGAGLDVSRYLVAGQYRDGLERALLEAHLGVERSLGLVMPKLSVAAVLQDADDPLRPADTAAWLTRLIAELRQERASSVLYQSGERFVSRVREVTLDGSRSGALRHGGTYLITGGCGGLGLIVARHLAEHFAANLVLTGRSPLDETRREALRGLAAGQRVLYVQADSCDADAMKQAVTQARESFGALHGVIHAAGVQGRGSILEKDLRSFEDVLGPKIRGTLTLDEAVAGEGLDFVCYFSSTAAVIGDFGTCDYAVGNRFQMAYARHRDAQVRAGRLSGRTVVVNWPLWREGGMGFDHDTTTMLLKSSGQDFLETADGVALFERLLSQEAAQHMILVGRPGRVSRFLGLTPPADAPDAPDAPVRPGTGAVAARPAGPTGAGGPDTPSAPGVEERLAHDLRRIVSGAVGLSPDRLHEDDNLADYGFDSVSLAGLATGLSEHWGVEVTPALFYSRSTLRKLREYFATEHQELLAAFYGDRGVGGTVRGPAAAEPAPPQGEVFPADRPRPGAEAVPDAAGPADTGADPGVREPRTQDEDDDAIAVIGMSGRFPGADNPSELWSILAEGRDAVSAVSRERLDLWGEPHDSPFAAFRVGQVSAPDEFDPLFFEMSPNEARSLDPRQRLLLQETWRALEDAGWTPASTRRVGMFVGVEQGDYDTPDPEAGSITANHDGILAARLSYLLDLSGPVLAINTACSSGLVAAHQACASIRAGESDIALAAGVSLITTSQLLTRTRQAGMLSEDGVTYAFDRRANGMVLSEAVAVVVLKRLSAAIADGDRIHGVIRASGINYDGRSNGITAPNGDAQSTLLRDTYRRHGIDPADIEYVVAHGTGTRLGDPVEVNALNDVFRGFTDKRRYCALTSVKSNVGHTLAASGLVSLIGVLQAMRHETIPASLNCAQENEYIDWKDSPFFVNKANRAWPQAAGRRRTAAISSFGMSGTNAHMVVESRPALGENEVTEMPAHLLALSAKSEESLRQRAADLIDFLEAPGQPHGLRDVGATLLDRRTHFRHRCAVVARDAAEAVRLLRSWVADRHDPDVLTGVVPKDFTPNDTARQAGDRLLDEAAGPHHDGAGLRDALRAAARAYCQGYDLAWRRLFGDRRTAPVALPGYPFARKRLWRHHTERPAQPGTFTPAPARAAGGGHRFDTPLTGAESFLRDHVVAGEMILPGVAHLELVRAAHAALPARRNAPTDGVTFRDVVWLRPVRVGDTALDLHVELEPDGAAGTRYRVLTAGADGPVVHSQGRVEAGDGRAARTRLDLAVLRTECGRYEMTATEVYLVYRRQGIAYGPSFQGVRRILVGDAQVLAELTLPGAPEYGPGAQVLPPGLLDAALQSSVGLRHGGGLRLPYAVEAVEILGPCEPVMWAWLRRTTENDDTFDVDLCDAHGEVRVRFTAFRTRPLPAAAAQPATSRRPAAGGPVLLEPRWEPVRPEPSADGDGPRGRTLLAGADPEELASLLTGRGEDVDVLLLRADDTVEGLRERLARGGPYDSVVWVTGGGAPVLPQSEDLITRQEKGVYAGFRLAKALLALGHDKRDLEWTALTVRSQGVVDTDRVDPAHAGVHGLLGSLAKENPRWRLRLADVEALQDGVLREALRLPAQPSGDSWAHRGGRWFRQILAPLTCDALPAEAAPYRRDRVYVVIGGAGGLGAVWTEHVVRAYGAQVVWIGRRAEDETIRARIDELSRLGPAPWYLQADATDREALTAAVARIKARFPEINGVVHSALALLDQSVARMPEERFRTAVRAKVDISVRIAQVFADEPLDFVLFFSSINSFQRSAGQSNYVSGCVFKDAFARLWRQSRPTTVKVMNWGYWGSVGVVASSEYQRRMERSGIGSIEPAEGMAALDLLLSGPYHQLAVEKTTAPRRAGDDTRPTGFAGPDDRLLRRVLSDSGSARGFDDALLCELLLLQLQTLGLNRAGGSVDDLRTALEPGGGHDRWLGESLRTLAEHGYLEVGAGRYTPTDRARLDGDDVWRRWEAVCRESEGANPYVNLLDPAIRELPEVLSGRRRATDVIFPGSSMSLVRGVYRDCESARALNELVAESVAARVEVLLARDPAHRVRIFEIGSGTGGTSEKVLRRLAPYRDSVAEYCYTDVSQYFLRNGRQEFGADHPYLRFELFDAECAPAEQGMDEDGYDIVLATNVLHATRDVRAAARHARALLGADGVLVLNELATRTPFLHLTFGLLDGWWRYEDGELRIPGCPGLAPETWQRVLRDSGFATVTFPAASVHDAGHQIVVAGAGERTGAPAPAPRGADDARERVRAVIVERLQTSLGLDRREISEEDSFADYGVDSILGVELTQQLSTDLGISLSVTDLFDHSSVRALAGYVVEHHLDASSPLLAGPLSTVALTPEATLTPEAPPTPVPEPAAPPAAVTVPASAGTLRPAVPAAVPDPAGEAVAVIGMSGRFGTAEDTDQLWQHLADGRSLVREISRWDMPAFVAPGAPHPRYASLMDDIDRFDPLFFQISGLEAAYMDPQQRIVLEEAWKALEDAGYAGDAIRGRSCGVYIGTQVSDYLPGSSADAPAQAMWGNAEAIIPARLSYLLDLQGPAIAVETACSGSLVALHLACQALRTGEIETALVGGVSVQCAPDYYLNAHKAGMLSRTGQCHTFAEGADGFVPGEGVGVVLLKRLRDALADGDHIHGVVRGSGINQDGTSNGITAPSAKSQERLERQVYDTFGIDPDGIQLVEAHGTGTQLGDPIEFQALTRAFRHYTDRRQYCAIGSVKTNIGHTAPASGMAGLIKILLALRHRELPRSLHFDKGNAHIDFEGSPFYVNTVHRPWTVEPGRPRRAALSSFGFSGTNAHVVVEEAPLLPHRDTAPVQDHLVVLSALSPEQVRTQAEQLVEHLRRHPDTDLGDIGSTLVRGRRHCPVRLACVARDTAHLVTLLDRWLTDGRETEVRTADLTENALSPQPALEQYGDSCLRACAEGATGAARREHLEAVSALYLQGYQLRYERLFEGGAHRRVPLPTYPFQRQRHWLPSGDGSRSTAPARSADPTPTPAPGPRADAAHLALAPVWVEERAPEPGPDRPVPNGVVVVGGSAADRAALAAERPGAHFLPHDPASTTSLTEQVRGAGRIRELVWISPAAPAPDPGEPLRHTAVGVVAFFRLVKALFELGYGAEELTWTVVTRQTQPVRPGEPVLPADAAVLGLAEVMAKELPDWNVACFDLGPSDALPARALLTAGATTVRALRDGRWFRRGLYRVELPAPVRSPYKEGGVYVVLGGAGGIGRLWSEDMIRRYRAQVVWIGRREKDTAIQAEIDRLAALGRAPWYVQADAADRDSLRGAYARIQKRFGTVHGVVQSVFGLVDQSLNNTTEQQFRQGLSAKIDASVCMADVFDADGLDFMLFFSSIASLNPTPGYCSYVAGNAFEDALSRRLSGARPYAVKVVNWGYWGAVGSGLDVPEHVRERIYRREGLGDIDPALAMDAVERLLAAPLGQVAYLNTSEPERFEGYTDRETVRVLDPAERRSEPLTPLLPSREEQRRTVEARAKSKLRTVDELLLRLLWCALHGRGWIGTGTVDAGSFQQAGGVLGKYDRWASETLKLFARQGWLVTTGNEGSYRAVPDAVDPDATAAEWERRRAEWLTDPELRASVELADTTLRALPDVLTGAVPAVDVIFPGSSLDLVEGIYKRNMIADHFNDVVGDCVVALVESRLAQDPGARIRILEIGAGTGGTTATVLRRLQPYQRHLGEYCYTDLSQAFLIHGRREFGAHRPFLRCEIFDAGRPVAEQGLDEGGYDLVIATNVLHATEDVRASLRNSKALLRSGGGLVVNEIDGYTVFGMLTFALLDGWWPRDTELREPGGPGLRPETWQSVLELEGFENVEFPARDAHPLGQQVVVGFSDGVIRRAVGDQRRSAADGPVPQPVAEPFSDPVSAASSAGSQPVRPAAASRVDGAALGEVVRAYLKKLVARTLLIPAESIDARKQLSAYGIDSILILQLLNGLKKDLGETSSTLFFEYRTIEALTEYFVTERGEAVARALGVSTDPAAEPGAAASVPQAAPDAQALAEAAPTPGPGRTEARPAPRSRRAGGVAIVGMSARFPQAETLGAFWSVLREGRNTVTEIPADRWALDGFYEPDREEAVANGRSYSKWGAFLDGFADFDPLFFEMTPNDALEIDPQERLFLQEAWRAFENAGYTRSRLEREHRSSVGVFVGITRAGHNLHGPERWRRGDTVQPYTSFGSAANRVSFKLNLNGPSMPVDTMCSSSLTALHEACEHLLHGDCELAVAGGVNLYLHPSSYVNLCGLQMLADGDECRSFGAGGNGFVPGEGVGALVLKRLEDAERDGDHIHAVIRGTSINHGGTTNGYTVPNPVAQGRVVRDALDRAGVDARTISYVEAHGTGTVLGDPIEINGLTRAFSQDTQDVGYCAIGSVKSNIGHAEAAAGIAGVFKAVLQMQHGELVASLHADEVNPHIDFDATPFVVQREGAEWKRPVVTVDGVTTEVPRRAGVSSFGAGGSNAHVVIEEYVRDQPFSGADRAAAPAVIVLSAKDEERLREQASALLEALPEAERAGATPADVAYTLQVGREAMSERLGTVVRSFAELRDRLRSFLDGPDGGAGLHRGRAARSDRALTALTDDADMSAVVGTWLAKGAYAKVLDLWVNGFEPDWGSLHPAGAARIVPLPAYPFARERYWIAERPVDGRPAADGEPVDGLPDPLIDDLLDEVVNGSLGVEAAAEHIRRSVLDGAAAHTDDERR
ncbi:SDR family NAD(P)-dependent oxidoreductase [Streptomyces sp. Tu 3180]|uniref:SDR family NAD(P)-dependent oxidoreductase n=1 Tax=Streptomyces sp. Tu 3180 TaxID=2682611 RepID=UPI00135BD535|nr:SDR family NAD(P)-dependent oxidoreductase [Streptomyces sp. Tu 3180]KAF3469293.1 SDR family NAD(P)-dependent oxidoreductase [Streptomyces sp. Tu 3180]